MEDWRGIVEKHSKSSIVQEGYLWSEIGKTVKFIKWVKSRIWRVFRDNSVLGESGINPFMHNVVK